MFSYSRSNLYWENYVFVLRTNQQIVSRRALLLRPEMGNVQRFGLLMRSNRNVHRWGTNSCRNINGTVCWDNRWKSCVGNLKQNLEGTPTSISEGSPAKILERIPEYVFEATARGLPNESLKVHLEESEKQHLKELIKAAKNTLGWISVRTIGKIPEGTPAIP